MIEIIKAILFGIVEGITEWLPVSSTGHLILLNQWVKFDLDTDLDAFMEMYDVVIQLGAILAVVVLFWKEIFPFGKKEEEGKKGGIEVKKDIFLLWGKIIVACIPGVAYGFLLDDIVEEVTAPYEAWIVAIMLIVVGIVFIVVENAHKDKEPKVTELKDLSWQVALLIGIFQLIAAVLPGTSRSGATIIGGLLLGLARPVAAEFTFYLAIPTMAGASLLKMLKFLKGGVELSGLPLAVLAVSTVTAFVVSILVIRFLMGYIRKHDFKPFAWYRIVLGLAVAGYFLVV